MITEILDEIWKYSEEERIPILERVLQSQLGGYGYGDQIAGVRTPIVRQLAKKYKDISFENIEILLQDELHEARFLALVILIYKFKKQPKEAFETYLRNASFVNNWDLVDISAPHIIGKYCVEIDSPECIWALATSTDLWKNRMAIVASWAFLKNGDPSLTLDLCKHFANHKHHLIHKAMGWMLREVGKKDEKSMLDFVEKNKLPKITVSYAKELLRKHTN